MFYYAFYSIHRGGVRPRFKPSTDYLEAGTLTTRPPHLPGNLIKKNSSYAIRFRISVVCAIQTNPGIIQRDYRRQTAGK